MDQKNREWMRNYMVEEERVLEQHIRSLEELASQWKWTIEKDMVTLYPINHLTNLRTIIPRHTLTTPPCRWIEMRPISLMERLRRAISNFSRSMASRIFKSGTC